MRICQRSDTYIERNQGKGCVGSLKKYAVELTMACLLLISFFFLSRQAAEVSGDMKDEKKEKQIIAIDPGHGGLKRRRKGIALHMINFLLKFINIL